MTISGLSGTSLSSEWGCRGGFQKLRQHLWGEKTYQEKFLGADECRLLIQRHDANGSH
jgi:hypothetical protein